MCDGRVCKKIMACTASWSMLCARPGMLIAVDDKQRTAPFLMAACGSGTWPGVAVVVKQRTAAFLMASSGSRTYSEAAVLWTVRACSYSSFFFRLDCKKYISNLVLNATHGGFRVVNQIIGDGLLPLEPIGGRDLESSRLP